MTLQTFVSKHHIRAEAQWADSNPNMDDMPRGSSHWRVILKHGRKRMTVPFSQGPAICHEPNAQDVLDCLRSDFIQDGITFDEWCRELGFDADSRKAERTFHACLRQTQKLRQFLGDVLADDLVFKVEAE